MPAGAAIREDALSAAGACCFQGAAAAAASTTTALLAFLRLVIFRTSMIILELATTTIKYCGIYLLSVQSPVGLSAGAAIRENPGSAAGACCCQCCCCCCCCFGDDCRSLPFYVWSHFVLV